MALAAAVVESLHVHDTALQASAGAQFSCATDVTDALVQAGGFDYRTAYRVVGAAVAAAAAEGRDTLTLDDLSDTGVPADELARALNPHRAVAAPSAHGLELGRSPPPR